MTNFFEIELSGIFDGTKAKSFQQEVQTAIRDEYDSVLVNCSQVTFMDSSGLGSLISALKSTRNAGKEFYLCAINRQISMLFGLTDTLKIFQIYPDRETFCSTQPNGKNR
jgi:anti-sigma B factor antagonist